MANIANIVIADGAATPVNHTFHPIQASPDALFREGISSLAMVGQGRIGLRSVSPASASLQRVSMTLELPALETVTAQNADGYTAAPKVAYTNTVKVEFLLPARGTTQQRKDLRVMLRNLLADTQIVDLVDSLIKPL